MKHHRLISLLIAASMLLPAVSACSESSNAIDEETVQETETLNADQAIESTEETSEYIPDDIPDTDFGGASVKFVSPTWYNSSSFIYASEVNGEVVNDAFYNQRMAIQDRFNATIDFEIYPDGFSQLENTINELIMSGDNTYDLVYNHDGATVRNAMNGNFLNLRSLSSINFDKPWFQGTSDYFTIDGKLFFTSNPLSISSIYMTYVLAINKDMAANHNIEIPYDQVRDGAWCFDDMVAMTSDLNQDLDGDGAMTEADQYGFLTQYNGLMCLQSSLGGSMFVHNSEGIIELVTDNNRLLGIVDMYAKLMENGTDSLGASNEGGSEVFVKGNSLFCYLEPRTITTILRGSDVTYGILPFPKYDENQQEYASAGFDLYWGIPITSDKAEITGTLVSAMSCYNYNQIYPLVWENILGSKLSDAPDDAEMFKIIRDVQYVDLGYACSMGEAGFNDYVFLLNKVEPGNVASFLTRRAKRSTQLLEKFNKTFEDLNG